MLRNFVNIVGIADPSSFPIITASNPNTQYNVQEQVTIPTEKPDVEQINSVLIEATITNAKTIITPVGLKIVIDGSLKQKVIYTADVPEQSVHSAEYVFPFCTFIEIPLVVPTGGTVESVLLGAGLTLDTILVGDPKVLVEDMSVELLDPRTINKCTVLFIWTNINPLLIPLLG
jgi:hypothetical protein